MMNEDEDYRRLVDDKIITLSPHTEGRIVYKIQRADLVYDYSPTIEVWQYYTYDDAYAAFRKWEGKDFKGTPAGWYARIHQASGRGQWGKRFFPGQNGDIRDARQL